MQFFTLSVFPSGTVPFLMSCPCSTIVACVEVSTSFLRANRASPDFRCVAIFIITPVSLDIGHLPECACAFNAGSILVIFAEFLSAATTHSDLATAIFCSYGRTAPRRRRKGRCSSREKGHSRWRQHQCCRCKDSKSVPGRVAAFHLFDVLSPPSWGLLLTTVLDPCARPPLHDLCHTDPSLHGLA